MRSSGYGRAALPATWCIPENVIDERNQYLHFRNTASATDYMSSASHKFYYWRNQLDKTVSTVDSSVLYICFGTTRFSDTISATGSQFCLTQGYLLL